MSLMEKSNNQKWTLGLFFGYCSKSGFGLRFENMNNQTNCKVQMYIVPKGQKLSKLEGSIGRGPQRKVI